MAKDGWTYEMLRESLARREFAPAYLLYGEEDFLADEAARMIIDAALTPDQRGFNLDVVYGAEADARDIVSHASSFPMMADRRVVVVRDADRVPNKELLSPYLEAPSETTCLLLLTVKPDLRRKPYVSMKRHGRIVEFKPLYENQIPSWIVARARTLDRSIGPDAARLLSTSVGTALREIQSELEKLSLYTLGRNEILPADVMAVVGASREFNIFELQRALNLREPSRALMIVDRMLGDGESPTMIIVMLTRHFTFLWRILDMVRRSEPQKTQMEATGLRESHLREYHEALGRWSAGDVERAFGLLVEADEALKSTGTDPKVHIEMLVTGLLSRVRQAHSVSAEG